MKRREFLKMGSFMTVSVAALGVTACGSSNEPQTDTVGGGSGSFAPNPVRPTAAAASPSTAWKFPQSIATGDPRPDSIIFWTRVVRNELTDTQNASVDVAVQLQVTTTDNSANLGTDTLTGALLADVTVSAYVDFDGTIRHKLTALTADSIYYYQFVVKDTAGAVVAKSKIGRTKTAPAAASSANVKFAFLSCQDWNDNHWGTYTQIKNDDGAGATPSLDFIVHLGDYIYETSDATPNGESLHSALVLPSGETSASGKDDYRYLYKRYRGDSRIQAVHERFPFINVWDDHEFSDDCWGDAETYTNDNALQPTRRRGANQAWFEFTPADIVFEENNPGFQNVKIYRDLKFGQTVHLVMTDERLYRADHMIPETAAKPGTSGVGAANQLGRINSRYLAPEATYKQFEAFKYGADATDPMARITMLGKTQRDWWKTTMTGSTAAWKIWGNEVSLLRMGLHGTNALGELIGLGVFGKLVESTGIPAAKTGLLSATATQLQTAAGAPASVATAVTAQVPSIAPLLAGDLVKAKALAGQSAGAIAVSAGGGGSDADKFNAAYAVLTNPGNAAGAAIPDGAAPNNYATQIAQAAVATFNKAVSVGTIAISTAVVAAVSQGATATAAGQGAFAITAKNASTSDPATLEGAAVSAGLTSAQAQAAAGAYLKAIAVKDVTVAAALAGAKTTGTTDTVAGQAALAITAADANPAATTAIREGAAVAAGLGAEAAKAAVAAYEGAKGAAAGTETQQIQAGAMQVKLVVSADIKANKKTSIFFTTAMAASDLAASLPLGTTAGKVSAFFQKFLLNADQWDGYSKERKALMNHLLDGGIQNVVAVTGDIHSFWAGQVYNDYAGEVNTIDMSSGSAVEASAYSAGQVAMVDLVTAGVSSTSWFNYIKEAADILDPTNALIGKLVYAPVPVSVPANALGAGSPAMSFTLSLNILDYSMGKSAPADANALAGQLMGQLKRQLAANGIPESNLTAAATGVAGMIAANASFQSALLLAQTVATNVAANPWLKHVDTDAQGYAVVTASTANLSCEFKKVNPLVGTSAPTGIIASTKTVSLTAGSTTIS